MSLKKIQWLEEIQRENKKKYIERIKKIETKQKI